MSPSKFSLSPLAATKMRLTGMRKLIATTNLLRLSEQHGATIRMTPDERLQFWTAERMANRPI